VKPVREVTRDVPADSGQPAAGTPTASAVTGESLAAYTTLRLGGPARRLLAVASESDLLDTLREAARTAEPVFLLAGGSNVVVADEGFSGTAILLRTQGFSATVDGDRVRLTVAAGEPWDDVVAATIAQGWAGLECLSGIPGSAGATPIQNVGAYGQEVAETVVAVTVYDRIRDETVVLSRAECCFGYRSSIFKHNERFVVLSTDFSLAVTPLSTPVRYDELAGALGVRPGDRVPLARAREAVLALRGRKGMVLVDSDPDTYSAGSFFTNPILDTTGFARVRAAGLGEPPSWPEGDGVKTSAAWLIERAGFGKGYRQPGAGVAISSKHTLALTNRGNGSTAALLDLAREIRAGVADRFGVTLHPEPVLVNCAL
jgi:UDP-N-acetylmuramate dehydrogenase